MYYSYKGYIGVEKSKRKNPFRNGKTIPQHTVVRRWLVSIKNK